MLEIHARKTKSWFEIQNFQPSHTGRGEMEISLISHLVGLAQEKEMSSSSTAAWIGGPSPEKY